MTVEIGILMTDQKFSMSSLDPKPYFNTYNTYSVNFIWAIEKEKETINKKWHLPMRRGKR